MPNFQQAIMKNYWIIILHTFMNETKTHHKSLETKALILATKCEIK